MKELVDHFVEIRALSSKREDNKIAVYVVEMEQPPVFIAYSSMGEELSVRSYNLQPDEVVRDLGTMDHFLESPQYKEILQALFALKIAPHMNHCQMVYLIDTLYRSQSSLSEFEVKSALKRICKAYEEDAESRAAYIENVGRLISDGIIKIDNNEN